MYIGRLFNSSYTTVIDIIKLQKNEQEKETLIVGLIKMINERMDSQGISKVHQVLRCMVLGIKYGMNDTESSGSVTELFSGEKSLANDTQCINGETVKKSVNLRTNMRNSSRLSEEKNAWIELS